nr:MULTISPECIES: matrixin family metalloprotease [Myxococcaceae]
MLVGVVTEPRFPSAACLAHLLCRGLAVLVLAALTLLAPAGAHAYELKRDSSGNPVRWEGAVQLVVDAKLAEHLGAPGAIGAADAAVGTVQRALGSLPVTVVEGTPDAVGYDTAEGAHNQSEIVALEDWPYDPDSLAVTVVTLDTRTHRILDADIAFNVSSRRFAVLASDATEGGLYDDVQNTLTHELGHAFGLAHNGALPDAVMYPSARRGETRKRALHEDDQAGLAVLYGGASAEEPPAGCSASGSGAALGLALLLLPLLLRRRGGRPVAASALCATALLLAAAGAQASEVRQQAAVSEASVVATTEVVAVRTLTPAPGARLLQSEVEVRVRECLKGSCPERMVLRVPGGRLGNIEQHVEGLEVPATGESVGVTVGSGASAERPAPRAARVYRLGVMADFSAFARGLSAAGWKGTLAVPHGATAGASAAVASTSAPAAR